MTEIGEGFGERPPRPGGPRRERRRVLGFGRRNQPRFDPEQADAAYLPWTEPRIPRGELRRRQSRWDSQYGAELPRSAVRAERRLTRHGDRVDLHMRDATGDRQAQVPRGPLPPRRLPIESPARPDPRRPDEEEMERRYGALPAIRLRRRGGP